MILVYGDTTPPHYLLVFGSSWLFFKILVCHIRFAVGNLNNRLEHFSGHPKQSRQFHPNIRSILSHHCYDPDTYVESSSPYKGVCIPIAICLKILVSIEKKFPCLITKNDVSKLLPLLNFHHLIEYKKNFLPSIPLSNFRQLDKSNTPIPIRLTQHSKHLSNFKGISCNLFRFDLSKTDEHNKSIHIFPRYLGQFYDCEDYLQIDMVEDHPDLWQDQPHNHQPKKTCSNHVLIIPNFLQFLYMNNRKYQSHGYRDCKYVCRVCQNFFRDFSEAKMHKTVCSPFPSGGKVSKRRAKNKIISHQLSQNPFTGKTEVSGLRFKRGDLNKLLLPLTLSSFDLESFMQNPEGHSHPSGAEKIHSIFAFALAHTSLHDHLPLPADLSAPRGLCYEPSSQNQEEFMMSFLLTLRDDAKKLSRFIANAFDLDPGPPSPQNFSQDEKLHWQINRRCIFCGNLFGSFRYKRNDTHVRAVSTFRNFSIVKTKVKVLPARDHSHLQLSSKLRA